MNIAAPLLALGGLYVLSNNNNEDDDEEVIENYENMEENDSLPNDNVAPINYPNLKGVSKSNVNKFPNPNTVNDRYMNKKIYNTYRNGADQFNNKTKNNKMESLTGETITKENFKHNNMVPFFGARIKGSTVDANITESRLDNMVGTGSQQVRKEEISPLFAPQKDLQYAHGMPNQSDFYQSRVMPGTKMSNVKLWDEQRVGPGLDAGFGTQGELGFNSGMAARDKWADRNVDQLRVATNPKMTYSLDNHQGPATYFLKAPATKDTMGTVEKHLPDTFFINTPDRWLTTTGLEKGQTERSIQADKFVNRPTTNMEYYGADSNTAGTRTYAPKNYEQPKRPQLKPKAVCNPSLVGSNKANEGDYGRLGYKTVINNRSTVENRNNYGNINGMVKAVVAPILDILRPTRKENVIGNCRINGNAGSTVEAPVIYNPADRLRTTIKETTAGLLDNNHLNVQNQVEGAYTVSKHVATENQRDTTSCFYVGDAGGANTQYGDMSYEAAYNQRNNVNKSYESRPNQGGMGLLNGNENIKIDKRDCDRDNNRMWVRNGGPTAIPDANIHGKINVPQYYDNCMSCERINPDILDAFKQNPYTQSLNSTY